MSATDILLSMKTKGNDFGIFAYYTAEEVKQLQKCWLSMPMQYKPPSNIPENILNGTQQEKFKWLWRYCYFSKKHFRDFFKGRLPKDLILFCVENNAIYPDGAINKRLIEEYVILLAEQEKDNG